MNRENVLDQIRNDPEAWLASVEKNRRRSIWATVIELAIVFVIAFFVALAAWNSLAVSDTYSKSEVDDLLKSRTNDIIWRLQHLEQCQIANNQISNKNNKVDCFKSTFPDEAL